MGLVQLNGFGAFEMQTSGDNHFVLTSDGVKTVKFDDFGDAYIISGINKLMVTFF